MSRVLLYFGSFNPIHRGHLAIAEMAIDAAKADELWFVVSPQNPFKKVSELAPEHHRLKMAELAIDHCGHSNIMKVSDIESTMPRPSYTINTLDLLRKRYPEHDFLLLMGSDNAINIERWTQSERLIATTEIFVYPREGYDCSLQAEKIGLTVLSGADFLSFMASDVREMIENKTDAMQIKNHITEDVFNYIATNNLYNMNKINIALLVGGDSSEREISLSAAASTAALFDSKKYNIYTIDVHGKSWKYTDSKGADYQIDKNDFTLKLEDETVIFDYAMLLIHGTPGEDGRMQGYLDMMGIRYISCDMVSSVLTFDKTACKRAVKDAGITMAEEFFVRRGDSVDTKTIVEQLGLPMFIKPNASGSSFGVSKVKTEAEIMPAIELALSESDTVLIEEFIEGREFSCGLAITSTGVTLLPITEIVSEREFFDYEAKYKGLSKEITPADLSDEVRDKVYDAAVKIYKRLGCRGIVRIDFIIKNSEPYMIEINTIPGMSPQSIIPQQARCMGLDLVKVYEQVMQDICLI